MCRGKIPKIDNTNTPVRSSVRSSERNNDSPGLDVSASDDNTKMNNAMHDSNSQANNITLRTVSRQKQLNDLTCDRQVGLSIESVRTIITEEFRSKIDDFITTIVNRLITDHNGINSMQSDRLLQPSRNEIADLKKKVALLERKLEDYDRHHKMLGHQQTSSQHEDNSAPSSQEPIKIGKKSVLKGPPPVEATGVGNSQTKPKLSVNTGNPLGTNSSRDQPMSDSPLTLACVILLELHF